MHRDGFNSIQKDKYMNTLITWNQLREMEEATQNRFNRFLGGFPNRIGTGETHSLTVADWSPEVDISQDNHEYLLKADLPEMKKDDVRVTVEDGILCVSGERKSEKEDQNEFVHRLGFSFAGIRVEVHPLSIRTKDKHLCFRHRVVRCNAHLGDQKWSLLITRPKIQNLRVAMIVGNRSH